MHLRTLLRRNLRFHRLGNLAVLLGVAVGTAVLAGALLVGDSLRGSLRERAEQRLHGVESTMTANRFFRTAVIEPTRSPPWNYGESVPATMLLGSLQAGPADATRHLRSVTVLGHQGALWLALYGKPKGGRPGIVDDLLDNLFPRPGYGATPEMTSMAPGKVWLNAAAARSLNVGVGDTVTLRLAKPSAVPRESLLGRRSSDDATEAITLKVSQVLNRHALSNFSLRPGVGEPLTAIISDADLGSKLGLAGRANVVLARDETAGQLAASVAPRLTLDDWGLVVHGPAERAARLFERLDTNKDGKLSVNELRARLAEAVVQAMDADSDKALSRAEVEGYYAKRGVVDLESKQMLLEPAVERAAVAVAKEMGLRSAPTLVYLANEIGDGQATVPYSVIAALDETQAAPLGPFLPAQNPGVNTPGSPLADDEIVLADWPASPLKAAPGATVTLKFFEPEQEGRIKERTEKFRLRGRVPLAGVAADPDLSPEFPGITDKLTLAEWDPPFPYDNQKVQKRDEDYWDRHRTSPKAYLSAAAGKKLFGSRFGEATSIRLAVPPGQDANAVAKEFGTKLLAKLDPAAGGFAFEDVRAKALAASTGGQDFGLLFLGFSFFLIAAALVLVGLLTRLNLERRASEVGLLLATGYRVRTVRRLLIIEGLVLAVLGGLLGLIGAVGYAALMLKLLAALWPDGTVGSFLSLHVTGQSLAIGYAAALLVSLVAIWWAVRGLGKVAPSALIGGVTSVEDTAAAKPRRYGWRVAIAALFAVALLIGGNFVHGVEERAGAFFGGGALALTAALMAVWAWLKRPQAKPIRPGTTAAVARLGVRNAGRNPSRSLLTAALLASAAFLLVAVESFRRSPEADFLAKTGGSGGYALVAESDLPLYQDPASPEGRQDLLDALERAYQKQPGSTAAAVKAKLADASNLLDATTVAPIRVKAGDDASCLNLYQPGRPRIVGVPNGIGHGEGRFAFSDHQSKISEAQRVWLEGQVRLSNLVDRSKTVSLLPPVDPWFTSSYPKTMVQSPSSAKRTP